MSDTPVTLPLCVQSPDQIVAQILVVRGKSEAVTDFVKEIDKPDRAYSLSASSTERQKSLTVAFRFPPKVPYRQIGGLIYTAQVRKLNIEWLSEPPLCKAMDETK